MSQVAFTSFIARPSWNLASWRSCFGFSNICQEILGDQQHFIQAILHNTTMCIRRPHAAEPKRLAHALFRSIIVGPAANGATFPQNLATVHRRSRHPLTARKPQPYLNFRAAMLQYQPDRLDSFYLHPSFSTEPPTNSANLHCDSSKCKTCLASCWLKSVTALLISDRQFLGEYRFQCWDAVSWHQSSCNTGRLRVIHITWTSTWGARSRDSSVSKMI